MLVPLGQRPNTETVVDLLLECHHRIRRFLAMAVRLAGARDGVGATEVAETAAQIRRYFEEALPLHVEDEEVDIARLLAGKDPDVDQALATMRDDHADHVASVGRLIAITTMLASEPRELPLVAAELAAVAGALDVRLGIHLALEERVVFPAVRALPVDAQDALRGAIRARRARALGEPA